MKKIIDNHILEAVVNYLHGRPYKEVHQIMPILMNLPDHKEEPPKQEEAAK